MNSGTPEARSRQQSSRPADDNQEAQALFKKHFNQTPVHTVRAPGRLELLGNHTDYNRGLVMSLAVDKYIYMAATPRNDGVIELVSTSFPGAREKFFVDKIEKNPQTPWANYTKGVLLELRKRGVHFTGFNGAIHGTIPFGAGFSSSAAPQKAFPLGGRQLSPFTLPEPAPAEPPKRSANGELPPLTSPEKIQI